MSLPTGLTDGRTPDRYITPSAMNATSVIGSLPSVTWSQTLTLADFSAVSSARRAVSLRQLSLLSLDAVIRVNDDAFLGRLFDSVDLIKPAYLSVRPSVRAYVRTQNVSSISMKFGM